MKKMIQSLMLPHGPLSHRYGGRSALMLTMLIGAGWTMPISEAETLTSTAPAAGDVQGVQVLTRGPVHEAFAGMIIFNPEPGIIVSNAPPALIEEVPPGERPEGNNITWIPGYWAWDEDATNFLWVSGTWRALPPGRQWISGYWLETTQGYQWTSGYWADAAARETTYLAPPPVTIERGPNVAAPSDDYRWTPGNWIWNTDRYAWGPGYWARGRADWDWIPSHYVWTPRGYIFVDGYWDYPIQRRGSLFAPVHFDSGVYSRSGHYYTPTILIDLAVFTQHLFLRPRYNHYYFGDYYGGNYQQGGYLSAYAYQSSPYGYDPIYSHQRWENRRDQGWDNRMATNYQFRRDHEDARPPRTWDAQRAIADSPMFQPNHMGIGSRIDQVSRQKDSGIRYQRVTNEERLQLAQRRQDVGRFRDKRRTQEAKIGDPTTRKPGELMAPTRVEQARSPIVGRSPKELGKGKTPPAALRAPMVKTNRPPNSNSPDNKERKTRDAQLPEPRQSQPGPNQPAATPRGRPTQPVPSQPAATPRGRPTQPVPSQPAATPRGRPTQPVPSQPAATPRGRPAQPVPSQPAATPRGRPTQPVPSQPAATPRGRPTQPVPSQPAATPRGRPAQPVSSQPAASPREQGKSAPASRGAGDGPTPEKGRKKEK